jgi:hypothetical protein
MAYVTPELLGLHEREKRRKKSSAFARSIRGQHKIVKVGQRERLPPSVGIFAIMPLAKESYGARIVEMVYKKAQNLLVQRAIPSSAAMLASWSRCMFPQRQAIADIV